MRTPYIAGNWKMNLDHGSALALATAVGERAGGLSDVDVALFPPAVYLRAVVEAVAGSSIRVGAQNCCDQERGAFTGETSAAMVRDAGATVALIGHSERRHVYGEIDGMIARKVQIALGEGLEVMLCVGETLEQREEGQTERVCGQQLAAGLAELDSLHVERISVAYEPVWAIGTGHTATPDQAQEVHAYCRGILSSLVGHDLAGRTRILYGGSVKAENARELLAQPDIDGALVGGASLSADAFIPIIEAGI